MSQIKKIFNSLLLCFCMLGCFGFGLFLQNEQNDNLQNSAKADINNFESVVNNLPEFIKLTNNARKSSENLVYLMAGNSTMDVGIASGENNLINGTGENQGKQNFGYIPDSILNTEENPNTEYYYFNFSNSLSLYYNVSNSDISNDSNLSLDNLLSGKDINLFAIGNEGNAFPLETYDITPSKLEMRFMLNSAKADIEITERTDTTPAIVTLAKEGCYTLAIPVTYYHTTNGGQTFSTSSEVFYYTFFMFDFTTYFDSATELPNSTMSNTTTSSLTNSDTHSTYYFYNYSTNKLPAYRYNPFKQQMSVSFTDTESNAFKTKINFDPATQTITQIDENGNLIENEFVMANYDSDLREITLTFNKLGEYDLSFTFLYHSNNDNYLLPITAKRQRLYNYGYQVFYTDYSKKDPITNTTIPQEFKQISEDETSFINSADITYALNNPQHQQAVYDLETLKNSALSKINEEDSIISLVSTNQTPIKFSSNANVVSANKYSISFKNGKAEAGAASKFDGLNINEPGTYLIVVNYQYSKYLSASGTVQGSFHHYQAFYFTVENKTPSVTVVAEDGKEIRTKGFTNKSVYILDDSASTLYDAKVTITLTAKNYVTNRYYFQDIDIKDFSTPNYGIRYFKNEKVLDYEEAQTGVYIDASKVNEFRNALYTIKIYTTNSQIPSSSSFTIDTNEITNLNARNVKYATSSTYTIGATLDTGKTNGPIVFSWDNKASGATTYGFYKYFELETVPYYHGNSDDSILLYSLIGSQTAADLLPVNARLNLNGSNQWTNYINSNGFTSTISSTYVRDQAGIYIFEVYDDAGNSSFEIFLLDNTSPLFVKTIESASSTIRSILSTNDTITVSPSYTATIEWAGYKGIYLTPLTEEGESNLYKSYAYDKLDKDENGKVQTLTNKLNELLGNENTINISGISSTPPNRDLIPSYNAKYMKIKVANNYYFQDAESSTYEEKFGKNYQINFFTDDNKAKEGTYKFLLRDESNSNFTNNEYGFLNYPSNFLTINVTSDSSKLDVLMNGKPLDREGYSLSGNFYEYTDDTGTVYSKTDDSTEDKLYSKSDLTYRYAYFVPVKSETPLTVSYIPVSRNAGRVSRVKNVKLEYYAYVKTSKEVTYYKQDGTPYKAVAWYYTLSSVPTRTIDIFNYSSSENYTEGQENTFTLSFSGTGMASEGKYVISRTYFEDNGNGADYDYYQRLLTLIVDRKNVITVQESVTNTVKDETTGDDNIIGSEVNTSLESIVGGDMLITMYSDMQQSSIQVAFPTYNPDTGLNSGSFFTKGNMDEDTIITSKLSTNKLPLSIKIPKYKYTENYIYDSETNSYSVLSNNILSKFGNGKIEEYTDISGLKFYNVIVEGVIADTFDTRQEAEAYLAKTEIAEYQLHAVVKFTSNRNVTKFYKTNGTAVGNYMNFYEVSSIDSNVPAEATPVIFTEAGTYDVTIYQAYNNANTPDSFRNFYRFAFEVLEPEPNFTILSESGREVNSKIVNNEERYYTNSQKVTIQWEDSKDPYIANLDKNPEVIYIIKDDGSRVFINKDDIVTEDLVNSITLDLSADGLNIWNNNRNFSITMQLEGHDGKYYNQVTKYVYVDYTAPTDNLALLMDKIASTTNLLDRFYQETNSRELLDYNENELDINNYQTITDLMANVSYSYSQENGILKYYAYNVPRNYFQTLRSTIENNINDPTKVQNIYYNLIGNVEDYLKNYTQAKLSHFSSLDYNNILDIDIDFDNIITGNYYEIVETDTAGNMVVYVIHVYDPDLSDSNYALSYTNGARDGEEVKVLDSQIKEGNNIYSNSNFEILNLDYLTDSWGIYKTSLYGLPNTYIKSPWLMLDNQLDFTPENTDLYRIRYDNGRISFTIVKLSDLCAGVMSSTMKHTLTLVDRFNGVNTNILLSIMDASLSTSKVSDTNTATLNILDVPTFEQANNTTMAYAFPIQIEIFQFTPTPQGDTWLNVADETNLTGNPSAWVSQHESINYSYIGNVLSIKVTLNSLNNTGNSVKLKYVITDNFGNKTTIIQLANEETCEEILGNDTIYSTDESDNSITYLSSNEMSYQYNRHLYSVEVEKYDGKEFVKLTNLNDNSNGILSGRFQNTQTINTIRFLKGTGNYDRIFRIKVYELETYEAGISEPVRVVNIRVYYKLPQTLTSNINPEETSNIWFLDKNNEYISSFGIINNMSVVKDNKIYTADATTINTYSNNITIFFDNGQISTEGVNLSYLQQYSYSVYLSMDGSSWLNINDYYSSGYRITGSGNYKVLITYDDENIFSSLCKIYDITILDSSSVFYYITVDGNLIEKSDIKYTDPLGRQYSENYIVSVNYNNEKEDRVKVIGNDELGIQPIVVATYPTGTNVYVDVYYYSSSISSGYFTIIYIYLRDTDNLLTLLNYEDASGSPIPLLGKTNETIVANETEIDFSRLRISWTEYYGISENAINIEVLKLFNNSFVPVDIKVYSNGTNRYAYLTRSGTYRIRFYDSCSPANEQKFGSSSYLNLVFLNSVPFTISYTNPDTGATIVSEPINRAVYNGEVNLSLVNLSSYFQTSGYPTNEELYKDSYMVTKDGKEYKGYKLSNYVFTFSETGYYVVKLKAISLNGINIRQEEYSFSIINKNESRYAYEFSPYSNYYIEKIVKDGVDITSNLITLAGNDTVTINGQKYLSKLLISYFDEKTGAGRYTITINTGEASYSAITATQFTFGFWINLTTPPVSISINEGDSTTDNITMKFNAYNLHDAVGDCYIQISTDRYHINSTTLEEIGGENATITITQSGTYYIQIYSTSNNLLYSYKVTKTDPLNTWAIISIVFGVIAAVAITFITIKLRKRLKVK